MAKLTDEQKANLSEELIAKAMQCETPEQLVELAKTEGYDLTLDEAQAYPKWTTSNLTANNLKRLPAATYVVKMVAIADMNGHDKTRFSRQLRIHR